MVLNKRMKMNEGQNPKFLRQKFECKEHFQQIIALDFLQDKLQWHKGHDPLKGD